MKIVTVKNLNANTLTVKEYSQCQQLSEQLQWELLMELLMDPKRRDLELLTRCIAKGTGRCGQPGDQTLKDKAGAEDSGGRAKNLCTWTVRV